MTQESSPRAGMHRREFLMLGSVATMGVAASVSAATGSAFGTLVPARQQLSVGFAEPDAANAQRVRSADHLRSGDADFLGRDARITVHGLWRPEWQRDTPAHLSVTVFHAVGDTTIPFLAWQHSRRSSAARVRFTTPVQADGTLPIGIERARPFSILSEPRRRFTEIFRTGTENDLALPVQETLATAGSLVRLSATGGSGLKLRRGTYFVSLLDRQPNWNALTAVGDVDLRSGSILRDGNGPVDFEYLVISVDRA